MSGTVIEHAGDGQMHAVGRRAIDEVEAVGRAAQAQRPVERQRIAGAAAVALGRDDGDVGDRRQRLGERLDARGEIAVVVAQQDAHDDSPDMRFKGDEENRSKYTECPDLARRPSQGGKSGQSNAANQNACLDLKSYV